MRSNSFGPKPPLSCTASNRTDWVRSLLSCAARGGAWIMQPAIAPFFYLKRTRVNYLMEKEELIECQDISSRLLKWFDTLSVDHGQKKEFLLIMNDFGSLITGKYLNSDD